MAKRTVFAQVRPEIDFPADERRILSFWKEREIFRRTLERGAKETFVFYEGPPTANGLPHNGHVLTRAVKDVFPRFHTMRGRRVPRKAGWDTHGLPVEVEVEKELGIHGKADIERYGVEPFVARCIESVFRYTDVWERNTERLAYWLDLDEAYVTYHRSYVESVWWALSELFQKGLLYQGHRVCWWWPKGGTALSAAEVGWNYKSVEDPSAYVAFPLEGEPDTALVAWTTTPWTLPSNLYAAVHPDVVYAAVEHGGRRLVVAEPLREALAAKLGAPLPVVWRRRGAELVGRRYRPPFDTFSRRYGGRTVALAAGGEVPAYFRVVGAEFVTLDTGTGVVHVAPAFGEDDFEAHRRELARYADPASVELLCAVRTDGTLGPEMGALAGTWIKDADPLLLRDLAERGLLVHQERYRHDYPYCWRADDDPLIQLARPAWYIRTTERIGEAIANNRAVRWMPEHIQEGRFGDFLAHNVDWALSRERYWGTPLNIWICTRDPEHRHAPASVREIEERNPAAFERFHRARAQDPGLNEHLLVHKPWIDHVTFPCPTCAAEMRRVPEVIDAWFDSGSMPFAQFGFPHVPGSVARFDAAFPADFISEAIDQTRGWFYSLLMISTLVFDEATQRRVGLRRVREFPHPYRTCIVLGHVCDREGKKESKSKGNYTPPEVILDRVRMEFAVLEGGEGRLVAVPGTVLVGRDDHDGLDLEGESARVRVYPEGGEERALTLVLRPVRGLPRRVAVVHADDRARLGVEVEPRGTALLPADVPRLPATRRVWIEDPTSPAPGADAFRWFFYAASPPWTNTRHALGNVRAAQKEFQVKLREVYKFFVIYATIDGFDPSRDNEAADDTAPSSLVRSAGYVAPERRTLLDRWMLSELALTVREVTTHLEAYRLYEAAQRLVETVDALSNWYVRRSRERFWAPAGEGGVQGDKAAACFTLYESLVTLSRLSAPFTPYFAEELHQNLVRGPWPGTQPESVHLTTWPEPDERAVDEALALEMRAVRDLVSLGLRVRAAARLKVRQPLARADVILSRQELARAVSQHVALIADELNVREVRFLAPGEEGEEVRYVLKPNFRALGPRLGKRVQAAKQALARADAAALSAELRARGEVALDLDGERVTLGPEEIEAQVEAAEGFAAAGDRVGVVVLHTKLDEELLDEGLLREVLARVQAARKELGLAFTDRIHLALDGGARLRRVVAAAKERIAAEVLAESLVLGPPPPGGEVREITLDGEPVTLALRRAGG